MKKMITTSVAVAALFVTSAQADFDFGEMFEDMKEAALTITKDSQDKTVHVTADPKTTKDASKNS
ncbi:hypothetical protein TSL6_00250 [Sulfurovum sp. TSL6]|uniref:hypothetical protein n=1 Tax=Sulfurovum sp. TSL6 TaxID=2826995 RepID=UPI001CC7A4F0|nr:hypothetical protein [Sulfurovum sp. TSL6]GIT99518.1 hypothetical protein TSL6_00250 [Sulfurovum sp. TSL6]